MKINSTFKVRQIKPENICIGDTIRWTTQREDMTVSNVGKVARRERYPQFIQYETEAGMEIGTVWNDGLRKNTITLLQPAPQNADTQIEGYDELEKVVKQNG